MVSILRYGLIFWGNSCDIGIAFKAQKKCVRAICGIYPPDSCKPYFIKLKLLTLPCLYIFEIAIFVKSNPDYFTPMKGRKCDKIRHAALKTVKMAKTVLGMAPKIYNRLPRDIRSIENINNFKKTLSNFLIDKAYYSINEYLTDYYLNVY